MNTKAFHRLLIASCLVLGFSVSQVGSAIGAVQSAEKQAPAKPSLYERLGGAYAIATVVDDFIEALLVNDVLNANPAIREARAHVPKAGLKFQVTALVCEVTGGPQKYTGRNMKESHAQLKITEKEWDAMVVDFVKVLDKNKVAKADQQELLGLVGPTKADIVTAGPQTVAK